MIGAASSGRTTAARFVADAIQRRDGRVPVYISSSEIRWKLYGSRRVDSLWAAIEARIRERLWTALQAGQPVPWVGWWLDTARHLCLQWNRQRQHPIAESVIEEHCAQLLQATGAPQRREGFAAVVRLETRHWSDLGAYIHSAYGQLEARIQAGALREGCSPAGSRCYGDPLAVEPPPAAGRSAGAGGADALAGGPSATWC
jgi:hypothetical protein